MHENMKTSMWHTGRSERTCRLPACSCGWNIEITTCSQRYRRPADTS